MSRRKTEIIQRVTLRAWLDGDVTTADACGMLGIDETELRRLAAEINPLDDRTRRLIIQKGLDLTFPDPRITPADILRAWQAGDITWLAAAERFEGASLPDLFRLAYKDGVEVRRHLVDEAMLPDIGIDNARMTPAIWLANPAWHGRWIAKHREWLQGLRQEPERVDEMIAQRLRDFARCAEFPADADVLAAIEDGRLSLHDACYTLMIRGDRGMHLAIDLLRKDLAARTGD